MGTAVEELTKGMITANNISGALNTSINDTNKTIGSMGNNIKNLGDNVAGLIGNEIKSIKTNITNLDKSVGNSYTNNGKDIHSKLNALFEFLSAVAES